MKEKGEERRGASPARVKEVVEAAKQGGAKIIRFQVAETSLVMRSMASHIDFLEDSITNGIGISKSVTTMNAMSGLAPGSLYGPESSEFRIVPDIETYAPLPFEPGCGRFIAELRHIDLTPYEGDSRAYLRRVLSELDSRGYEVQVAFEAEFFVLKREGDRWVANSPIGGIEGFIGDEGYGNANDYLQELFRCLSLMNVGVARLKKESGPAQLEVILHHTAPLKAADDFITLRDAVKGVARTMGLTATFLPKPLPEEGPSGLHVHLSLRDKKTGKNVFFDPKDGRGAEFSKVGYGFIAGILAHIRGMMPVAAPLPNSYKRLFPSDVWVPVNVTYGYDNRSVNVRIPSRGANDHGTSSRIEFRMSDGTANPYLLLGLIIKAGLDGVVRGLDPGEPFNENAYLLDSEARKKRGIATLPEDLGEAIDAMEEDRFIRRALGDKIYNQYLRARRSEWATYCRVVSPWEVDTFIQSF